tara:strand:+ start:205 stop:366 length:162 start_codon:yes stop_codon:yes gene_type:complete
VFAYDLYSDNFNMVDVMKDWTETAYTALFVGSVAVGAGVGQVVRDRRRDNPQV